MVSKSSGSAIASVTAPSSIATGKTSDWRRKRGGMTFQFGSRRAAPQLRDGKTELFRRAREQIALGEIAHVDENFAELLATLALQFEGAVEIFGPIRPRSIRSCPSGVAGAVTTTPQSE